MKYLLVVLSIFIAFNIYCVENLESYYIRGVQSYKKGDCNDVIKNFNKYISLNGDIDKIIYPLTYCQIDLGMVEGKSNLEKIYQKDKSDQIVEILFKIYISNDELQKGEPLLTVIKNIAKKDNELYYFIAIYYFKSKKYEKTVQYLDQYKIPKNDKKIEKEFYYIKSAAFLELKKYKEAITILEKLLPIAADKDEQNKIKNLIKNITPKTDGRGGHPVLSTKISNFIVFDSNINSQPPFTEHFDTDIPIYLETEDSDLTAMGVRDEFLADLTYTPLANKRDKVSLNGSIFTGIHYPYVIDELLDPQDYDILSLRMGGSYQFKYNFSKVNQLIAGIYLNGDINFISVFKDFTRYFNGEDISLFLYFSESKILSTTLFCYFRWEQYNQTYTNKDEEGLDSFIIQPNLIQHFNIKRIGTLSIGGNYTFNNSDGSLNRYHGTSIFASIELSLFKIISFNSKIAFSKRWYDNVMNYYNDKELERIDTEIKIKASLYFNFTNYFNVGIKYSYTDNDSDITENFFESQYIYTKHLGGIDFVFNF